jgi:hypothetical protein
MPWQLTWIPWVLAVTYEQAGQLARAEPLHREFVEHASRQFGPDHPRTTSALADLGLNLLRQQKFADAERPLRDCLARREKNESDDWTTFNTKSMLGEALLGQKKHEEAEPLLLQGYAGLRRRQGLIPTEWRTVRLGEALRRLVRLYEALGQKDEAAKWRKRVEALEPPVKRLR